MSFLRKRSRSQCSLSLGDDQMIVSRTEPHDFDRKSRSDTINSINSARTSCSESDVSDFAVHDSCVVRNFPKQKSSHLQFLAWVAYTRRFTDEWISEDERRTCPLLWCRAVFKDQDSMLQHVWSCEHLSKGLYWCFHCQKPERVGKSQCRRCQGLPTRADRVASVAKRIFSKLGAKPSRHEHSGVGPELGKTLSDVSEAVAISRFPNRLDEKTPFMETGPVNWVQQEPQELPNTSVVSEMPADWTAASVELPDSPIAEMVGTECPIELGDGTETWADNFYAENLEDWDVPLASSKGRGRSPKLALDTSVPPVLSSFYEKHVPVFNSNWAETSASDIVISPLSPNGGVTGFDINALEVSPTDSEASVNSFFTDSGYSSATSLSLSFSVSGLSRNSSVESKKGKEIQKLDKIPEVWVSQPVYARPVTMPDLPNNIEDLSRRSSNASHSTDRCIEAETSHPRWTSSSNLLQSFANVLDLHIKHTRATLEQMSPTSIIMELLAMSRSSMVSIGLDVLAGILEGRQPTAIVQVFAFTHVACAAAIAIDGDKTKVYTQAWFHDSLMWIPERQRPLYLQIAKCIWAPSGYPGMEGPSLAGEFPGHQNIVLNACKDFLHLFESTQILETQPTLNVERRFDFAQSAFERNAKIHVINELKKSPIEGFIKDVMHVEWRLSNGKITCVRGLELELICAGKLTSQSDSAYGRFQEIVMILCNTLYGGETRAGQLRMSYYIKDISTIKHMLPEPEENRQEENMNHEKHAEVQPPPSEAEDDDDVLEHFDFESFERDADEALRVGTFPFATPLNVTEPMSSISSEHLAPPQQNSAPPHYSNNQPPLVSQPSTPHSQMSPSPYLPPQFSAQTPTSTSMPPPSTYRCHCGYVPTGEEKWKASNLRRHKRTQHPVEAKVYPCPFPGCTSQFSRSDNLRDHQRRKGHEVKMGIGSGSGNGQGMKPYEQPYQYNTLDLNLPSIRLLFIGKGETGYELQTFQLSECPPYIALSYTWGPPEPTRRLSFKCGRSLIIRWNLGAALKALESNALPTQIEDGPEFIWIDAIYINQRDIKERNHVKERNHGVGMMSDIFSKARCTISWLGEDNFTSDSTLFKWASQPQLWQSTELHLPGPYPVRDSLFSKSYWQRLWVVQEVLLAQEVILLCESGSCRWQEMPDLMHFLSKSYTYIMNSSAGHFLMGAETYVTAKSRSDWFSLGDFLQIFGRQKCEDSRDLIFGLLSLERNRPEGVRPILADYEEDYKMVDEDYGRYFRELSVHFSRTQAKPVSLLASKPDRGVFFEYRPGIYFEFDERIDENPDATS